MLKKVNQKGFTIIEVLIVLAIAGVIMLVVFLAVPALQRTSRNTQRTSDAALISASVNECLSNNNGVVTAVCDDPAAPKLNTFLDTTKLRQLTDVALGTDGTAASADKAIIVFGAKCDTTGTEIDAANTTGGKKSFVVLFQVENTSGAVGRCVES